MRELQGVRELLVVREGIAGVREHLVVREGIAGVREHLVVREGTAGFFIYYLFLQINVTGLYNCHVNVKS